MINSSTIAEDSPSKLVLSEIAEETLHDVAPRNHASTNAYHFLRTAMYPSQLRTTTPAIINARFASCLALGQFVNRTLTCSPTLSMQPEQAISNPPLLTFTVVPWIQILRVETTPGSSIGNLRKVRRSLSNSLDADSKSSSGNARRLRRIARRLRLLLSTTGMIILPGINLKPSIMFYRASRDRFRVRRRGTERR